MISSLYDKFLENKRLTDAEVHQLWTHFSTLERFLDQSGPRFALAYLEARRVESNLSTELSHRAFDRGSFNPHPRTF